MTETVRQYVDRILSNVGGEDPFAILESTPSRLRDLVRGASLDALSRAPEPGRWSVREILAHLADAEIVGAWRLRTVLAADNVPLQAYDQDTWRNAFKYADVDANASLDLFEANRRGTLALLRRVDRSRYAHAGLHEERGRESIEQLLRLYAGHDRNHLRQIEAILASTA